MSTNNKPANPVALARRQARRLRLIGGIVLLLGIGIAGVVYWLGTRSPDLSGDLSMVGYDKATERQMGMLYGKQGELIEDLTNGLKQPGTQAILIIVTVALVAGGCFYFARLLDHDAKNADNTDTKLG